MAKKILDVKPTRMELLRIRKRKALAMKGYQLLSEKRDALISSFFKLIKERKKKRQEMEEKLMEAYKSLIMAEMVMGEERVHWLAEKISKERGIKMENSNIMGVSIP